MEVPVSRMPVTTEIITMVHSHSPRRVRNRNSAGIRPRPLSSTSRVRASEKRNMFLKMYGLIVLMVDICIVLVTFVASVWQGFVEIFVPPIEKSIEGEIVLVTGTGHGIGRELAIKFASLGSSVACLDINEAGNAETARIIAERTGVNVHPYKCDVSNREEVFAVVSKIREDIGDVTILVNNAGIMPCKPLLKQSPDEIRNMFNINVVAHFWTLEAVLPSMVKANHGHIVALSSMAGVLGLTNLVPYCASKYAVRGMMEAISEELKVDARRNKVEFTTIYPYMVDTGLCKKPRIRFPSILSLLKPDDVAEEIVRAMRRNYHEISIPRGLLTLNAIFRAFPAKVAMFVTDLLDSGVEECD